MEFLPFELVVSLDPALQFASRGIFLYNKIGSKRICGRSRFAAAEFCISGKRRIATAKVFVRAAPDFQKMKILGVKC